MKRNPDGTFAPGTPPGPGRPKGKTLKEFAREYFMMKTEEEKRQYIEKLEEKRPGFIWEMAEGRAKQDVDIDANITGPGIIRLDE